MLNTELPSTVHHMTFMYGSDSTKLAFTMTKSDKIFSGSSSINLKQKSNVLISNNGLLLWTDLPLKILLVLATVHLDLV
jgi:hypothetical protein